MDPIPRQLGPYTVESRLRVGGGGNVYRGVDAKTGRIVALKTPRDTDQYNVTALRREAGVLQFLADSHVEGVVQVLDSGLSEPLPWFAMELLEGPDLRALRRELWALHPPSSETDATYAKTATQTADLAAEESHRQEQAPAASFRGERGSLPVRHARLQRAYEIGERIAMTLAHVHDQGLIHGDISPSNVLCTSEGQPVLLDFGTAFALWEPGALRERTLAPMRTRATPGYAAPELLKGKPIDSRCDIYSLGCLLYELSFGQRPFNASDPEDLVRQHLYLEPPFPVVGETPAPLISLLKRMLEKEPQRRTAQARSVVDVLREIQGKSPITASGRPGTTLFRPRFVGRSAVVQRLSELLRRALEKGELRVLVTGTSGVGKTRVLNELGDIAGRARVRTIACQARDLRQLGELEAELHGAGFEMLASVFAAALPMATDEVETAAGDHISSEARAVLSPFAQWPPGEARPPELSVAQARERVFNALVEVLGVLAGGSGLLLLLDDLQWADELSIEFLKERADALAAKRVLWVGASRADGAPRHIDTLKLLAQEEVELGPLDQTEVCELTKDLLGAEALPEALLDYVIQNSEGNPFFVGEYTRLALRRGLLAHDVGGWSFALPPATTGLPKAPPSVQELLHARTESLSTSARRVMRFGAVLGREFDDDALSEMAQPELNVSRALLELVAHQILVESAPSRYRFTHDKLREAAERQMDPEERRELHLRAARSLEREASSRDRRHSARLGFHWAGARVPKLAVKHLVAAAEQAEEQYDIDFACELCRAAIHQCQELAETERQSMLPTLNEHLGSLLVSRARHVEARLCYSAALEQLGGEQRLARARLQRKLAATFWTVHNYLAADHVISAAERSLGVVSAFASEAEWQEYIQIRLGRFEQLYFSQQVHEASSVLDELSEIVEDHGTAKQRSVYCVAASSSCLLRHRYRFHARALELGWAGLRAAENLPLEQQALARMGLAFALGFGTDLQRREALPHMVIAGRQAREANSTTLLSRILTYHCLALVRLGDVDDMDFYAEEAAHASNAAGLPPYIAAARAYGGWLAWRRHEPDKALRLLTDAREIWTAQPSPFPFRWPASFPMMALVEIRDDFETARQLLEDLLHPTQQALPAVLIQAIETALQAYGAERPRLISERLREVVQTARSEGFC